MASSVIPQLWIVLFVGVLCVQGAFCQCPPSWITLSPGCYRIFTTTLHSFDWASLDCKDQGGYLARDTSQAVHDELKPNVIAAATVTADIMIWIGLTDNNSTNGSWMWDGGSALGTYRNFANTNVQNTLYSKDCVYIKAVNNDFKWYTTANCNALRAYMCQKDFNAPTVAATTTLRPLNCPTAWSAFPAQKTCIKLMTSPVAMWSTARRLCQDANSDLIRMNNTALNTFVANLVAASKGVYWIGLTDRAKEDSFTWLDDINTTNFTNWNDYMPNNSGGNDNCVVTDGNKNNKWETLDCSKLNRFICQRNPNAGVPRTTPSVTQPHVNCGTGWEDVVGSDTCITFNVNVLTWLDAQTECTRLGGNLASISNLQEQYYISARALSYSADMFWIGANDRATESGWHWSDGSPFAFLNWDDKQPDNSHDSDCTVMSQRNGRWDDVPCTSRNGYICKKKGMVTLPSVITTTTEPAHLPADVFYGCPRAWDNFRGSCYRLVQLAEGVDWATAGDSCASSDMQGALVAIIDADENKYILSLFPNGYTGYAWIGMQDPQENTFTWVDNTPVQYTNWQPGEPNNMNNEDCVTMNGNSGKWNDAQCSITFTAYICKKSKTILPRTGSEEEQGCTNGSLGYGARCYTFVTQRKNFVDAQKDCRLKSQNLGNLATVDSGHLQAFLAAELDTSPGANYWIGLQQISSVYTWKSNTTVSFTYWGKNHTGIETGTCVAMQHSGLWANYHCTQVNNSYICESPRTGFTTPTTKTTKPLPCPTGWPAFGNLCYKAFFKNISDQLSWSEAKDYCARQADGGSLVTIGDNATQFWLFTNLIKTANITSGLFWIGLNDRDSESGYAWLDHSQFLYTNWGPNQPDDKLNHEDCVNWVLPSNYWNDDYCSISNNWICQVPRGSKITTPKPAQTGAPLTICGSSSWTLFSNNYCYFVSPPDGNMSLANWFDARQICISMGADLASILGEDENGFLTSMISKIPGGSFWIGLNDLDLETYGWTDQSAVKYINWALNEPNDNYGEESCVEMRSDGNWNDNQCQNSVGYVCKKLAGGATVTHFIPVLPDGGCPANFVSLPSLGYCYYLGGKTNSTRMNYDGAVQDCKGLTQTSHLASVHSSLEEKFILILMDGLRTPAWIGFNDRRIRNQFEWVDNQFVSYTNWGPRQPDENLNDNDPSARRDCVDVEIGRQSGTWNDKNCNSTMAYICESIKVATLPTTQPNSTGCNAGFQRFRNGCYKFFTDQHNWINAETLCKAYNGNLVTVNSGTEQAFVEILTGHVNDSFSFWLGITYDQLSTTFVTATGSPIWFTNWGQGEPQTSGGQDCVTHTVDGKWKVVNCTSRYSFICEINIGGPPPNRTFNYGRCPRGGWTNLAGNCYLIQSSSPQSWSAATAECSFLEGSLASIHSAEEARALTSFIGSSQKDMWIGLSKGQESGFSWNDGTELEYVYWQPGEPNDPDSNLHQDCVKMNFRDGTWADTDCSDQNAYLCKRALVSWFSTSPGLNSSSSTSPPFGTSPAQGTRPSPVSWPSGATRPSRGSLPSGVTRPSHGSWPSGATRPFPGSWPSGATRPHGSWPSGATRPSRGSLPSGATRPSHGSWPSGATRPSRGSWPSGATRPSRGSWPSGATRPSRGSWPSGATRPSRGTATWHRTQQPNVAPLGSNNSDVSGGGIAGIVIGILILVALVTIIAFFGIRYYRQNMAPYGTKKLLQPQVGFDNATYSTSGGVQINVSDA